MPPDKNKLGLQKINYILLAVAAILLVLGYVIMSQNEITVSPLILAGVYVVFIPFALLYKPKNKDSDSR